MTQFISLIWIVLGLSMVSTTAETFGSSLSVGLSLPGWVAPGDCTASSFEVPPKFEKIVIWGRGNELPRHYAEELLPATFERTLAFESFSPGNGRLDWLFTGPQGGFTVAITATNISVTTRCYDSPAFLHAKATPLRHPEQILSTNSAGFDGQLQSVTVRLDHRLGLTVCANGVSVMQQPFLLDVSRHQIMVSDVAGHASGQMLSPAPQSVRVQVKPKQTFQTMIGFGGITSMVAFNNLDAAGRREWWDWICRYNLLIQREYPIGQRLNQAMDNWDNLPDAAPHYYGDNFPVGEVSDFNYNRTILRLGGQVWFEFWKTPDWAGEDASQYAEMIVRYCQTAGVKAGAPPAIVGVQNERKPADAQWFKRIQLIRKALDDAGFEKVQLHMNDASRLKNGLAWARTLSKEPAPWQTIDYCASHFYDYQDAFTNPDSFDSLMLQWKAVVGNKPFLSTELCVNDGGYQVASYRLALAMGQLYHKNLVLLDAAAICYCWLLIDTEQPSYGWTRSLFMCDRTRGFAPVPSSHQLRVFGAYSRRIRAGMQRVAAVSSASDLLTSAFTGNDGTATLVLLNRSTAPIKAHVDWPGIKFTEQELSDPYHENAISGFPSGTSEILVQPGSVVTLTDVPLGRIPKAL